MQKTLSFFWSGGENTSPCFQQHCFLCLLDPWDCGIGTKMIFSLVGILMNLRRCRLHIDNLNKLIFISKNWPRLSCSFPFNLIGLIDVNFYLEEAYKGEFEQNKLVDM